MICAAVIVLLAALGGQRLRLARGLSRIEEEVRELRADALRDDELRDLGERVARLEERTGV